MNSPVSFTFLMRCLAILSCASGSHRIFTGQNCRCANFCLYWKRHTANLHIEVYVCPNLAVADLCICLKDREPGDCRKTLLCSGRSRSQRCCRRTSDTLLSGGCSCQQHWGLCCRYTDMDGTVSRAHCCPEGLQSNRHHRAHISCLGTRESEVKEERPEAFLLWITNGDILSSLAMAYKGLATYTLAQQ